MTSAQNTPTTTGSIGLRVVCGIDGTPEGMIAARQAARLVDTNGSLTMVSAYDIGAAAETGFLASRTAAEMQRDAEEALESAAAEVGIDVERRLIDGEAFAALAAAADRADATLVVVGTHELGRGAGIVLGSVATASTHMPTRATLIARDPDGLGAAFPRSLAVAEDGSAVSEHVRAVGGAIAERFDAGFRRVACSSKAHDLEAVKRVPGALELLDGDPKKELVRIGDEVDLLVVGSSSRRGLHALGSVSERVAHKARCSVLIVPAPA